jgi:hypothetical protein
MRPFKNNFYCFIYLFCKNRQTDRHNVQPNYIIGWGNVVNYWITCSTNGWIWPEANKQNPPKKKKKKKKKAPQIPPIFEFPLKFDNFKQKISRKKFSISKKNNLIITEPEKVLRYWLF